MVGIFASGGGGGNKRRMSHCQLIRLTGYITLREVGLIHLSLLNSRRCAVPFGALVSAFWACGFPIRFCANINVNFYFF